VEEKQRIKAKHSMPCRCIEKNPMPHWCIVEKQAYFDPRRGHLNHPVEVFYLI